MRRISPDRIDSLAANEVFVFGSNLAGQHGAGAARTALDKFGAVWGAGDGFMGRSYAIPTMHGGRDAIAPYVDRFIAFAKANPKLKFLVTRIGCGIAGFTDAQMASLFVEAVNVDNIYLPQSFWDAIEKSYKQPYVRFMRMIAELHKRGYELLRLCPSVSPSGCAWRALLTPKINTWIYCGALLGSYEPGEGLLLKTNGFMPWFDERTSFSAEEDADMFVCEYPILASATKGEDKAYVQWFLRALDECEHGYIIFTKDDYDCCVCDGYIYGAREPFCYPPAGESRQSAQCSM